MSANSATTQYKTGEAQQEELARQLLESLLQKGDMKTVNSKGQKSEEVKEEKHTATKNQEFWDILVAFVKFREKLQQQKNRNSANNDDMNAEPTSNVPHGEDSKPSLHSSSAIDNQYDYDDEKSGCLPSKLTPRQTGDEKEEDDYDDDDEEEDEQMRQKYLRQLNLSLARYVSRELKKLRKLEEQYRNEKLRERESAKKITNYKKKQKPKNSKTKSFLYSNGDYIEIPSSMEQYWMLPSWNHKDSESNQNNDLPMYADYSPYPFAEFQDSSMDPPEERRARSQGSKHFCSKLTKEEKEGLAILIEALTKCHAKDASPAQEPTKEAKTPKNDDPTTTTINPIITTVNPMESTLASTTENGQVPENTTASTTEAVTEDSLKSTTESSLLSKSIIPLLPYKTIKDQNSESSVNILVPHIMKLANKKINKRRTGKRPNDNLGLGEDEEDARSSRRLMRSIMYALNSLNNNPGVKPVEWVPQGPAASAHPGPVHQHHFPGARHPDSPLQHPFPHHHPHHHHHQAYPQGQQQPQNHVQAPYPVKQPAFKEPHPQADPIPQNDWNAIKQILGQDDKQLNQRIADMFENPQQQAPNFISPDRAEKFISVPGTSGTHEYVKIQNIPVVDASGRRLSHHFTPAPKSPNIMERPMPEPIDGFFPFSPVQQQSNPEMRHTSQVGNLPEGFVPLKNEGFVSYSNEHSHQTTNNHEKKSDGPFYLPYSNENFPKDSKSKQPFVQNSKGKKVKAMFLYHPNSKAYEPPKPKDTAVNAATTTTTTPRPVSTAAPSLQPPPSPAATAAPPCPSPSPQASSSFSNPMSAVNEPVVLKIGLKSKGPEKVQLETLYSPYPLPNPLQSATVPKMITESPVQQNQPLYQPPTTMSVTSKSEFSQMDRTPERTPMSSTAGDSLLEKDLRELLVPNNPAEVVPDTGVVQLPMKLVKDQNGKISFELDLKEVRDLRSKLNKSDKTEMRSVRN